MNDNLDLPKNFFQQPVVEVAKQLIGKTLVWYDFQGIITETEGYNNIDDEASHAFRGVNKRSALMHGPHGFLYIYLIYGMYHCLNIVTGDEGSGSAVLIRGIKLIQPYEKILNGPGKLCRELGINMAYNGMDINSNENIFVREGEDLPFIATPRIGITKAKDKLWRFIAEMK